MGERVGPARRRPLDLLLEGLGILAGPVLKRASRAAILPGQGSLALPGLAAAAEVHYDDFGVPHIRARTDSDAFRVQGYCHARDRFFQMDMLRRVLRGGLSEAVGERPLGSLALPPFSKKGTTVDADHLMRVLDLLPAAKGVWAAGRTEGRALLTAYSEGVNAALLLMRRQRPLEHRLLRLKLKPWTPLDSILVAKGMALGLSFKWRTAPIFTAVAEALEKHPEHLNRILPRVPGEGAFAIAHCIAAGVGQALSFLPVQTPMVGSNAWLVGSERSASGKPLLASDPHLELSLPAIWHLSSVHGRRYQAVGAALPGLPGIVVGRTPSLAWGLTNAMLDDADLWVEELDDSEHHYKVDGEWRPLPAETQSIARRGKAPYLIRVRRTHRGPLLSDAFSHYEGPAISMRMALQEPSQDMDTFLGLGRARSVDEALQAGAAFGSPAQNLLLADTKGQSAYRMIGLVPLRSQDDHPALPRDGTKSATDWTGFAPDSEMPRVPVAPGEHLVSANHPVVDGAYPHYLSHLYEPDYRAARIAACLDGRAGLTADDMRALQADAWSPVARRFRTSVLTPQAETVRRLRPTLGAMLDRLLAWDGDERIDAKGALPSHLVYHHLVKRVFAPLLGAELTGHWMGVTNLLDAPFFDAFENEDSPWAPKAIRATLLAEAMEDARKHLQRLGLGLDSPWGVAHTLTLKHPLGSTAAMASTFNRGPFEMPGGPFTVASGQYLHARPGPMLVGQSYRHVVDLAEPEAARMITFGGQSGHVGSPHYDDLTPLWLAGETVAMRLESLPEHAEVLRLLPG